MLTVRTSENTVIKSFRLISERQDFSSVRTGENTVRARARIQVSSRNIINTFLESGFVTQSIGRERSGRRKNLRDTNSSA